MIGALLAKKKTAAAFDALNRHDLAAFMSGWRDDAAFVYPGEGPASGAFEGRVAVEAWFRRFLDQFPVIRFAPRDICVRNTFDCIGNNVIATHWTRQMTNRDGWEVRDAGVTLVTARFGKILRVKNFCFDLGDGFRRMRSAE